MQSSATDWLKTICSDASGAERKKAIGTRLGIDEGTAQRMLAALDEALTFVASAPAEGGSAVDDEKDAISIALRLAAPIAEARMQRRLDAIDAAAKEAAVCRKCGRKAHSVGRRRRSYGSLLGVLSVRSRTVNCEKCVHQFGPAREKIGLSDGEFTPRMEEVCTMLATTVPHGMAVQLLEKMLGTKASEYGVQRMVERRGQAVEQILSAQAAAEAPFNSVGLPRELPPSQGDAPGVAYLEIDGVLPMTREELRGSELSTADKARQRRAKKAGARGGRGKRYRLVGKEVKNAVLYSGGDCARESASRGCLLDKRYVSHLGEWKTFALLVWAALRTRGYDRAKLLVLLSDGAEWIRSLAEWLPVPVFLILDLFHVKHRVWEVAHLLYGDKTPAASKWANTQCDRIENGEARDVIRALRFLRPSRKDAREKVAELVGYLSGNLDRMDYPAYRERGLRVTSGIVESANYHVTGTRLKLQGMRWSEDGAREMATLRADLFNNQWEERTRQILHKRVA